jgi:cation transport protein ChaC
VFGYGSLMWHPGFAYAEAVHARLAGFHRCFCIWSVHYRGTAARPGLVLGLDRGGVCDGMAFRVPAADASAVLAYLRRREQVTGVYREALVPVTLRTPHRPEVMAVAYLAEPAHPGYAGALPLAVEARLIRSRSGLSGSNLSYFASTLRHLGELGIREPRLARLATAIGPFLLRDACRRTERSMHRHADERHRGCRFVARRFKPIRPGERRRFLHRRVLGAWSQIV